MCLYPMMAASLLSSKVEVERNPSHNLNQGTKSVMALLTKLGKQGSRRETLALSPVLPA